jgi:hypothetical protein
MRVFVESSDIIIIFEFGRKNVVDGLVVWIGFGCDIALGFVEQDNLRRFFLCLHSFLDGEFR